MIMHMSTLSRHVAESLLSVVRGTFRSIVVPLAATAMFSSSALATPQFDETWTVTVN